DLAGLELEVADDAGPFGDVNELGIVAAGGRIRDAQPLVRINRAVLVVLALVGTPVGRAGGGQVKLIDGVTRQVPEAHRALGGEDGSDGCREHENDKGGFAHDASSKAFSRAP